MIYIVIQNFQWGQNIYEKYAFNVCSISQIFSLEEKIKTQEGEGLHSPLFSCVVSNNFSYLNLTNI